jgi:putative ABC transport system permease protein
VSGLRARAGLLGFAALHLRRFREHRVRTLLSVLGIAAGTALVVAVTCVYWSMAASIDRVTTDVAGQADLEVGGLTEAGFDQALLQEIDDVAGVRVAAPMVRGQVVVNGEQALLFGFDKQVEKLAGRLSASERTRVERATGATLQAAVGPELATLVHARAGTTLRVEGGGAVQDVAVTEVVRDPRAAGLNRGVFLTTGLPVALAVIGKPGRLDAALVVFDKGASPAGVERRIAKVVQGRAYVDSPTLRADQARTATKAFQQGLQLGAALAVFGAAFLVFTTMNMAALERRRELATLRAIGGQRGPLLRGFLAEAALLGVVAGGLGVAIGLAVSRRLVGALPSFLVSTFGVRIAFEVAPFAIPLGVAAGLGATLAASWFPARRAVRVPPVEAMRPEGVLETRGEGDRVAWIPTLLGAAGFTAAILMAGSAAGPWFIVAVAMAAMSPSLLTFGLAGPISSLIGRVAAVFGPSGRLAGASAARAPRRTWATTAALTLTVAIVVVVTGLLGSLMGGLRDNLAGYLSAELIVSTSELGSPDAARVLPPAWRDELANLPGVKSVTGQQFQFVTLGEDKVELEGVEAGISEPSLTLLSKPAATRVLAGEGVAVSTRFAKLRHLDVGDRFALPTAAGVQRVRVLDTFETFKWERGVVVLSLARMQEWFPRPGYSDLFLAFEPGAKLPDLRRDVERFVADRRITAYTRTGPENVDAGVRVADQAGASFDALRWIVTGGALFTVLNALLIAVIERRRELGILRAVGTERAQLRWAIIGEAAAVAAVGAALGLVVGSAIQSAFSEGISDLAGVPIRYHFTPRPSLISAGAALGVAIVGGALPAWRAARVPIIEAIGYE